MKSRHLKRAILLGLAMSVTAYSMGMAENIKGPISDFSNDTPYSEEVTITNGNPDHAAIQIGHKDNPNDTPDLTADVNISTAEGHNITIDSKGYGIRTENGSTGTIQLTSSKDNIIRFGSGSGISADSKVGITLSATAGTNSITYTGTPVGNAETDDYDGINVGADNAGNIELTGAANTIDVQGEGSDGIYTASGSTSSVTLTANAENGNNTITAGNNGIDHRGSGTVTLQAENGGNWITAGEGQTTPEGDGVRIEGNGNVILTGQYNTINAADDGLYIKGTSGENASISVTASGADANDVGNYIEGNRGIAAEAGKINVTGNGGINWVQADTTGIWAKGAATSITMQGTTSIIVNDGIKTSEDNPTYTNGIYVSDGGKYEVIRDEADEEEKDVSIDVTAHAKDSAGIWAESQGTVDMETKDFHLGIINEAESSPTGGNQVYGIFANQSTVGIDASGSVEIGAQGATSTTLSNVYGIYAATGYESGNSSGPVTYGDTKVEITGTAINIAAKNAGEGEYDAAYGVALDKHVSDDRYQDNDKKVEVKLHSTGEEGITIDATAAVGSAYGVRVTNVNGLLGITADAGDVSISADGKSVNGSSGVYVVSNAIADSKYNNVMAKADIHGVNTFITATGAGIGLRAENQKSQIAVTATDGNNTVKSDSIGIYSIQGAQTTVTALGGNNLISADTGIYSMDGGNAKLEAKYNCIQTESYGLYAYDSPMVALTNPQITLIGTNGNNVSTTSVNGYGIYSYGTGANVSVSSTNGANVLTAAGNGITAYSGGAVDFSADVGDNSVTADSGYAIWAYGNSTVGLDAGSDNVVSGNTLGIQAESGSTAELIAGAGNSVTADSGYAIYAYNNSTVGLDAGSDNVVSGKTWGIKSASGGTVDFIADTGDNSVTSDSGYAIFAYDNSTVGLDAGSDNVVSGKTWGIQAESGSTVDLIADAGDNSVTSDSGYAIFAYDNSTVGLDAGSDNAVSGKTWGLVASQGQVQLSAKGNNQVSGTDDEGIYAYDNASVALTAAANNFVAAGTITEDDFGSKFGNKYAVMGITDSTIRLAAAKQNVISGAVYARGTKDETTSTISLGGLINEDGVKTTNPDNFIYSAAVIANAGDLPDTNKEVISALYAEDGAVINVSGRSNTFRTTADPTNPDQLERVIWAYNGADITVDGTTTISTDSYKESPNSADIAIAAGTAVGISAGTDFNTSVDRAEVNLNYGAGSSITGDILAGYLGEVNINQQETAGDAGIKIEGNLLAGNNGILNVDLGKGGTLEGRADDYGDAGVVTTDGYTNSFRHPAFSSGIYKGGAVNLTMGEGARWNVTGQSWVTSIDTKTGKAATVEEVLAAENPFDAIKNMATIDLVYSNTDYNETAHAMTIYEMKGDAVFNMSLDGDRTLSDMLYMKKADGSYIINVVEPVTLDDMYAIRENGERFDGLRFATVGEGSDVSFRAVTIGDGVLNVEYEVGTDLYVGNDENEEYNSTAEDGTASGNSEKPGDTMVDGFFESDGTPVGSSDGTTSSANYMVLSGTDTEEETQDTGPINYKLIGRADEHFSNAGQTIIDMSKVNYSNAVYMDRLNKRMGEARYLEGDDGLWVRIRHDRIGKEDAFRSMNTMMELGYDRKVQSQKDGEHRRGVAFDYMRGTADYTNVMGDGDVRRAGVWLYDTWLGDKGHYSDYVLKYGRLSNDFDIFSELGDKISGDYDNDVWSASAEYGRKKDIGNEWYFEPQAQLQYAYVTSADYTTSQGSKVELDGIDSLIGRAGFRLGRDTSEGNTVYFKADILHEFLGDQSIRATDSTGVLSTTYENEGTWYDVGFGFSHRMGKDSYMFLDLEHSFGNDNDETYQINIGLSKAF